MEGKGQQRIYTERILRERTVATTTSKNNQKCSLEKDLNGHYEVDAILDKRIRSGIIYYFIRWKGYSDSENSWVP